MARLSLGPDMQPGDSGQLFSPGSINLGRSPGGSGFYTPVGRSETVRATGNGPFDPAYRQNLATFAAGQLFRPGGSLSFDPTGRNPLEGSQTLLSMALGQSPFNFSAGQTSGGLNANPASPVPAVSANAAPAQLTVNSQSQERPDWRNWANRWKNFGRPFMGRNSGY